MAQTLEQSLPGRLERSCERGADPDRIRIGRGAPGIERLAARFHGRAFAPHRHDTYAIGVTISGVQTFRYRGVQRHCQPGQCHILHPDELHDGAAGTEEGFSYRIAYVDPALIQKALGGKPLPFVRNPVIDGPVIPLALRDAIGDGDAAVDELADVDFVTALADMLAKVAGNIMPDRISIDTEALGRVRDAVVETPEEKHTLAALEQAAGLDRWTLARQFRAAFGVSPSRFRTMRQLDRVRREVRAGAGLAEASLSAGFADQSHMTRAFVRQFAITPARYQAALG
jgi:AraC-like DNA-binding protein